MKRYYKSTTVVFTTKGDSLNSVNAKYNTDYIGSGHKPETVTGVNKHGTSHNVNQFQ